ncbi:hypothetical protein OH77DRAFT_469193 [Trametes cingulata]|nr:hypothetical protein OH77DRAFT_469193 [Trametes cingulata]
MHHPSWPAPHMGVMFHSGQSGTICSGCLARHTPPSLPSLPHCIVGDCASSAGIHKSIHLSALVDATRTITRVETATSTMTPTPTNATMNTNGNAVGTPAFPVSPSMSPMDATTITDFETMTVTERTTATVIAGASSADGDRSRYLPLAVAGFVLTALTTLGIVVLVYVLLRMRRQAYRRRSRAYPGVPRLSRSSTMSSVRGLLDPETQVVQQGECCATSPSSHVSQSTLVLDCLFVCPTLGDAESPADIRPTTTPPTQPSQLRSAAIDPASATLSSSLPNPTPTPPLRPLPAAIPARDSLISYASASAHPQEQSYVPESAEQRRSQHDGAIGAYGASGSQSCGASIGSSLPPAYDDLSDGGPPASGERGRE